VVRRGGIVFERYDGATRAADANNICSMSKSMLSVLVGFAFDEGRLRSTDQKLLEFFPDYVPSDSDPRKRLIHLRDVLRSVQRRIGGRRTARRHPPGG